jgi:hypothetical protein
MANVALSAGKTTADGRYVPAFRQMTDPGAAVFATELRSAPG